MIAEKFEALIAFGPLAPAADAGHMRQRVLQEFRVGETMSDPLFKRGSGLLPLHRTSVNNRLHRTDVGHAQISQAARPSSMEKKMICARPTRFSCGT